MGDRTARNMSKSSPTLPLDHLDTPHHLSRRSPTCRAVARDLEQWMGSTGTDHDRISCIPPRRIGGIESATGGRMMTGNEDDQGVGTETMNGTKTDGGRISDTKMKTQRSEKKPGGSEKGRKQNGSSGARSWGRRRRSQRWKRRNDGRFGTRATDGRGTRASSSPIEGDMSRLMTRRLVRHGSRIPSGIKTLQSTVPRLRMLRLGIGAMEVGRT